MADAMAALPVLYYVSVRSSMLWGMIQLLIFLNCYSLQMMCVVEMTHCERNVRSPGTSRERAISDVQVLVPLDRGLSASGSIHSLSFSHICLPVNCSV